MYRSTGVDHMELGTVQTVMVRDVTNKRSLHSVKTGSAQFVVDGSVHFKLYSCCCFCSASLNCLLCLFTTVYSPTVLFPAPDNIQVPEDTLDFQMPGTTLGWRSLTERVNLDCLVVSTPKIWNGYTGVSAFVIVPSVAGQTFMLVQSGASVLYFPTERFQFITVYNVEYQVPPRNDQFQTFKLKLDVHSSIGSSKPLFTTHI